MTENDSQNLQEPTESCEDSLDNYVNKSPTINESWTLYAIWSIPML